MKIAGITGLCGALLMLAAPVFLYGENPVVTPELKPVITLEAAAPAVKPPEPAVFKSIAPEKFSPGKCYPDVKISGSGFLKSAILKLSSESLSIDSVAGISSDTITFSLTVKEDARPGKYDITLINSPDNTVNIKNAVQILSKPEINAVLQKEVRQGSLNNEITLSGAGFLPGAKLEFVDANGDIVARYVTFKSDKELKAAVDLSSTAKPGFAKFKLINSDGESAVNKIAVTTAFGISSVLPQVVPQGANSVEIAVKGENLNKGLKAETKDEGLTVNNMFVLSENEAVINVTVGEAVAPGKKEITVTTPDGGSQKFNLTVSLRPVITSVSPDALPQGAENRTITIIGNNFCKDTQFKISTPGVSVVNFDIRSAQQILAVLAVSDRAAGGTYDTLVSNPDGGAGTLANSFKVNLKPEIKTILPGSAVQGVYKQEIEINGQGFAKDTSVKIDGEGIVVDDVECVDNLHLKVLVTVGAKAPMDKRDVFVLNSDGGFFLLANAFGINKVDKDNIYYGDINRFKKPAMVNKKKLYLEHPQYKVIVRENISSDVARYWLILNKINESTTDAYKRVQKKYDFDLIGENGFVADKDGNPVKDVPDITDLVIHELEK